MSEESNVIPETELARRRAVLESVETIDASLSLILEALKTLREAGLSTSEALPLVTARFLPAARDLVHANHAIVDGVIGTWLALADGKPAAEAITVGMSNILMQPPQQPSVEDMHATPSAVRMKKLIARELEASQKLTSADTPAIEAILVLRGFQQPIRGSLSTTPEGLLRLLCPAGQQAADVFLEHFFDYSDVVAFILMRTVKPADKSRIITQ